MHPRGGLDGTHTADVGDDATWDLRYNEFRGLGRIGHSASIGAAVTIHAVKDILSESARRRRKAAK